MTVWQFMAENYCLTLVLAVLATGAIAELAAALGNRRGGR